MTLPPSSERWIVSAKYDLAWFISPGFLALLVVIPVLTGTWQLHDVSPIAWLVLVVGIDVAHVWSTLFRTYLDKAELRRRPGLYWGTPVSVFVGGFLLHSADPSWFWTVFAYVAVFHFIKQQYGFVSIYRHKAGEHRVWLRTFDKAAVYAGAGVPVVYWHTQIPRDISWFIEGDFVGPAPVEILWLAWPLYVVVGAAWFGHRIIDSIKNGPQWGRDLTMLATWLTWYVGIVVTDVDFVFTATNVVIHGVPYAALVWHTSRVDTEVTTSPKDRRPSIGWFIGLCLALALFEEGAWDLTVWGERAYWFGELPTAWRSQLLVDLATPLLMVPQATHYILDGYIWKMDGSNPTLRGRLTSSSS